MARILIVEDEPELRDDLADALRAAGHQPLEAPDGRAGLDLILRERPDLVLSDISMPVMDGHQLLDALRASHPEHGTVPFVFLSALAGRDHVVAGKRLGADDYLTKPVDHELLVETVNARLRQAERFEQRRRDDIEALQRTVLTALPHELRTPLNGILGFAELLRREADACASPRAGEYAAQILDSGNRLKALVDSVLDLVAVGTGRLAPQPVAVDVESLLRDCTDAVRAAADAAGVDLQVDAAELPLVHADPRLLRRAVVELLCKAVEASEAGSRVRISAAIEAGTLAIRITDTGQGIDPGWLPGAAPDALMARADGGLGLSLARAFVELQGGSMTLTSRLRLGTEAEIRLALRPAADLAA